jgi:hypothetical protein
MSINIDQPTNLLRETLIESRSFKKNPVQWSIFYGTAVATGLMFIILCSLSAWSISLGTQVNDLVVQGSLTLTDVQDLIPKIEEQIRLLETICEHENFTKSYGDLCNVTKIF